MNANATAILRDSSPDLRSGRGRRVEALLLQPISLYGLVADPANIEQSFGMLGYVLPQQAYDIVMSGIAARGPSLGRDPWVESLIKSGVGPLERQFAGQACRRSQYCL